MEQPHNDIASETNVVASVGNMTYHVRHKSVAKSMLAEMQETSYITEALQ
jgi:hypothetical protein